MIIGHVDVMNYYSKNNKLCYKNDNFSQIDTRLRVVVPGVQKTHLVKSM